MANTNPTFPPIPGLTWSVTKTPQFKTRIQKGVSGRELRLSFQPIPTWQFEISFSFLRDANDTRQGFGPGYGYNELRALMGFFVAMQGSLTPFNFDDPSDDSVTNQLIGTGDGSTTVFQLVRTLPGGVGNAVNPWDSQFNSQFGWSTGYPYSFNEPIISVNEVTGIYVNSVRIPGEQAMVNYNNGTVTFQIAPVVGATITATFTYFFLCRFDKDAEDFENFFYQLWSKEKMTLQSVLL